jgi:hypothetical protein
MSCRRTRKRISEYIDGTLNEKKARKLESHLEGCSACREVLDDLRMIAGEAKGLETPAPSPQVWTRIQRRMMQEPGRDRGVMLTEKPAVPTIFPRFQLKHGLAAFLMLAVIGGVVYFGLGPGGRVSLPGPNEKDQYALAKLEEAERYYELAIKSLAEALTAQKENLSPQMTEMLESNIKAFDITIDVCRQAVMRDPASLQARDYLLAAYQEKMSFLGDILEMNRKSLSENEFVKKSKSSI